MEFDELSRQVIGCAIEVHRELGPGLRIPYGHTGGGRSFVLFVSFVVKKKNANNRLHLIGTSRQGAI